MKKDVKISDNYISVMYNGIPSYGGSQLWFDGDMHKCGCGVIAAADVLMYLKHRNKIKLNKHDMSETTDKFRRSDAEPSAKERMPRNGYSNVIAYDTYIKYVEKLRPAFPLIPGRGMPCFMLALYLKIYMLITRMPYRVGFGAFFAHPASDTTMTKAAGSSPAASDDNISDIKITACAACNPLRLVHRLLKRAAARKHTHTGAACETRLKSCISDMLTHDIPVILCIGPGVHQFTKPKAERGIMLYSRSETVCCSSGSNRMSLDCASAGSLSYFTYTPARRVRSHFVVITELSGDYAKVSSWGKAYYISVKELTSYSKLDMFGLFTNVVRIRERQ